MSRTVQLLTIIFLFITRICALNAAEMPNETPPVPIESVKVSEGTLYNIASAQGELKAEKSIILQSDIPGKVIDLHLTEGKSVQAGETIIKLEDSIYSAALKQAKAKHELSALKYERVKKLLAKGTGSSSEVEEALASLQFDEASVELATANVKKTRIIAPFSGVLGLKDVDIGDYISPGEPLVELVDISNILVDFYLPEKYLLQLKEGLPVQLQIDAIKSKTFMGKIYAISPALDSTLRAIHARAVFDNADFLLKPGLFSRLNIVFNTFENALTVPEEAILYKENSCYVYKIIEDKVALTEVRIGVKEKGMVQILSGLAKDDEIVLAGQIKLFDGAKIIVTNKNNEVK